MSLSNEELRQELDKIAREAGELTPEAVEFAARDPNHPLHDRFTWDNEECGLKYRVIEARNLIRSVKVTVQTETNTTISTACYVHDPDIPYDKQGYVPLLEIRKDSRSRTIECVRQEFARAESALSRARDIAAVLGHSQMIEELIGEVVAVREKASV